MKLLLCLLLAVCSHGLQAQDDYEVNFEFAPEWWQSPLGLPGGHQKTMVGKEGQMFYEFDLNYPIIGPFKGFNTSIQHYLSEKTAYRSQTYENPKVAILTTRKTDDGIAITEDSFQVGPALIPTVEAGYENELDIGLRKEVIKGAPGNDIMLVNYHNTTSSAKSIQPHFSIKSVYPISADQDERTVDVGKKIHIRVAEAISSLQQQDQLNFHWSPNNDLGKHYPRVEVDALYNDLVLKLDEITLQAGESRQIAIGMAVGKDALSLPATLKDAQYLKGRSQRMWERQDFGYDKIIVPDPAMQDLVFASIRNIQQAKEIKNGLPSFQVGATHYRGLWAADGSSILVAMTNLGQLEDAERGIDYLKSFQQESGQFKLPLLEKHWKETGMSLWAINKYARLTANTQWLEENWSYVEKGFTFIVALREASREDPDALSYGLIPKGFSDGGYMKPDWDEYTNVYWSFNGMKAAIGGARWLAKNRLARQWQAEYDDMMEVFQKSAARDMRTDEYGNAYLPIRMSREDDSVPQKAQWAFLHAVFPGKVLDPQDPIVQGNFAMLKAAEQEGMVVNTAWHPEGVWSYFASFFGHALLWSGDGQGAIRKLYAMANHASPTLHWREEQNLKGDEYSVVGDMPQNWASAELIRLIRHCMALERGSELHLFEGLPAQWARPGMVSALNGIYTEFGIIQLKLAISEDGKTATLDLDFADSDHQRAKKIILHQQWNDDAGEQVIDLGNDFPIHREFKMDRSRG